MTSSLERLPGDVLMRVADALRWGPAIGRMLATSRRMYWATAGSPQETRAIGPVPLSDGVFAWKFAASPIRPPAAWWGCAEPVWPHDARTYARAVQGVGTWIRHARRRGHLTIKWLDSATLDLLRGVPGLRRVDTVPGDPVLLTSFSVTQLARLDRLERLDFQGPFSARTQGTTLRAGALPSMRAMHTLGLAGADAFAGTGSGRILGAALARMPGLTSLNLARNVLGHHEHEARDLARALAACDRMVAIDLSLNALTSTLLGDVLRALVSCGALSSLCVSDNELERDWRHTDAAGAIAALALVHLDMRGNDVCDVALANAISELPRLERVLLGGTQIDDTVIAALSRLPTLKFVDLRYTRGLRTLQRLLPLSHVQVWI